ncbi:hypothetical protein ABD77_21000 [Brevibacillus formosus]|nr:hypothetical protein [Brevibacillus formosus]
MIDSAVCKNQSWVFFWPPLMKNSATHVLFFISIQCLNSLIPPNSSFLSENEAICIECGKLKLNYQSEDTEEFNSVFGVDFKPEDLGISLKEVALFVDRWDENITYEYFIGI